MRAGNGWRVNFDGPDSQGQATYTMGPRPGQRAPVAIDGSFKRVVVHTDTARQDANKAETPPNTSSLVWPDLSPSDLPALSLYVADFEVDDTAFGALHTDARVTDNGWSLDRFELAGGALTGRVAADWQVTVFADYSFLFLVLPPGAFFATGLLIAAKNVIDDRLERRRHQATQPKESRRVRVTGIIR